MAITAAMVKDLRERTGAGMMDCKKALVEVGGDMEKAVDYLREKGMAKAAKKPGLPWLPCSARPTSCPAVTTSRISLPVL